VLGGGIHRDGKRHRERNGDDPDDQTREQIRNELVAPVAFERPAHGHEDRKDVVPWDLEK